MKFTNQFNNIFIYKNILQAEIINFKKKRYLLSFICFNLVFAVFCIGGSSNRRMEKETSLIEFSPRILPQPFNVNPSLETTEIKSSSNLESKKAYAIVIGISDYPGSGSDLSFSPR